MTVGKVSAPTGWQLEVDQVEDRDLRRLLRHAVAHIQRHHADFAEIGAVLNEDELDAAERFRRIGAVVRTATQTRFD